MSETILSIEEVEGYNTTPGETGWEAWTGDGFCVVTSEREILLLVSDGESCCEQWGHVASEDDVKSYVGATLMRIDWTGDDLCKRGDVKEISVDDGDVMFVDFVTDRGVLQLAVYNAHNGYYGHPAVLIVAGEIVSEECL